MTLGLSGRIPASPAAGSNGRLSAMRTVIVTGDGLKVQDVIDSRSWPPSKLGPVARRASGELIAGPPDGRQTAA
jgi:hypothetical protein